MDLSYGSVCSGIEAATVAWEPLGWKPVWFAQFDPEHNYSRGPDFPSKVLARHYPSVANLGDMTKITDYLDFGDINAPDVLVGGTPCQAFSMAGLRKGLSDSRGQLTLKFVELADRIDQERVNDGKDECIVIWENVPGVLNTKDNAFGCFIAALSGHDEELYPPTKRGGVRVKWPNSGCVIGPTRTVAWRVLDAQYFGLAQRRRRVFVVASARERFHPAQVLFEFDGMCRDSAPSREMWEKATGAVKAGAAFGGNCQSGPIDVATARNAHGGPHGGPHGRLDFESETFVVSTLDASYGRLQGCSGQDANHGYSHLIAVAFAENSRSEVRLESGDGQITGVISTGGGKPGQGVPCVLTNFKVRRLTPSECEELQGFRKGYTEIPIGNRPTPDGHRYKAIGNSMATKCMAWLGKRIERALVNPWCCGEGL